MPFDIEMQFRDARFRGLKECVDGGTQRLLEPERVFQQMEKAENTMESLISEGRHLPHLPRHGLWARVKARAKRCWLRLRTGRQAAEQFWDEWNKVPDPEAFVPLDPGLLRLWQAHRDRMLLTDVPELNNLLAVTQETTQKVATSKNELHGRKDEVHERTEAVRNEGTPSLSELQESVANLRSLVEVDWPNLLQQVQGIDPKQWP